MKTKLIQENNPRIQCTKCGKWRRLFLTNGKQTMYGGDSEDGCICVDCVGKTKLIQKIKKEYVEKVVDILRAVHVHGVDGDFDGCDGLDKDPQSMSVQTATKKISKIIESTISQTKQELVEEIEKWLNENKYPERNGTSLNNVCYEDLIRLLEDLNKK